MRVAVIGHGIMGAKHASLLQKNECIEKVFIVDPKIPGALNYLPKSLEINFAIIATPTSMHKKTSIPLLQRGIHLLIEKPIASSVKEAESIIQCAKDNNCKVVIGHIERFNPVIQTLISDLSNDEVFLNCSITRMSPFSKRIHDIGVSLDLGIHDVDLIQFITKQKIVNHSLIKFTSNGDHEGTANFLIELSGGSVGMILNSWMCPIPERTLKLLTESSYYIVDILNKKIIKHGKHSSHKLKVKKEDALNSEHNAFINYIENDDIGLLCSAEDAIKSLKIILEK